MSDGPTDLRYYDISNYPLALTNLTGTLDTEYLHGMVTVRTIERDETCQVLGEKVEGQDIFAGKLLNLTRRLSRS